MLNIPYIPQPDPKSCALASNAMVAKYFFPEVSLEDVAELSGWKPGYALWPFRFWLWMMKKGIRIEDFDSIDYEGWAKEGIGALKTSVPDSEFKFYKENSFNLDSCQEDIKKIITNKNFVYHKERPEISDLEKAINRGAVCEVVLNSPTLDSKDNISLHRVTILGTDNDFMFFNDPGFRGAGFKVDRKLFEKAWLGDLSAPELCIYEKNRSFYRGL